MKKNPPTLVRNKPIDKEIDNERKIPESYQKETTETKKDIVSDESHVEELLNKSEASDGETVWSQTLSDVLVRAIENNPKESETQRAPSIVNNQPEIVYQETVAEYAPQTSSDNIVGARKNGTLNRAFNPEILIDLSFVILNFSLFALIYLSDWALRLFSKEKT